jgi:hypothetical protein
MRPTVGGKTMKRLHECSNVDVEHRHVPGADWNTHGPNDEEANFGEVPTSQEQEERLEQPPSPPPPAETEVPETS